MSSVWMRFEAMTSVVMVVWTSSPQGLVPLIRIVDSTPHSDASPWSLFPVESKSIQEGFPLMIENETSSMLSSSNKRARSRSTNSESRNMKSVTAVLLAAMSLEDSVIWKVMGLSSAWQPVGLTVTETGVSSQTESFFLRVNPSAVSHEGPLVISMPSSSEVGTVQASSGMG